MKSSTCSLLIPNVHHHIKHTSHLTPFPSMADEAFQFERNIPSSSPLSSIPDSEPSPPRPPRASPPTSPQPRRFTRSSSGAKHVAKAMPERPKPVSPKKRRVPKWDAESLLTDPKSPLAKANLRTILSNPMAWSVLGQDEKTEILSLFPDKEHILDPETEDARPNFASLLNDDSFRYDCAAYTENIAQGRHEAEWLASAWAAHERRKAGDFDDYLLGKLQDEWGVEVPGRMTATPEETAEGDAASAGPGERDEAGLEETRMEVDGAEKG